MPKNDSKIITDSVRGKRRFDRRDFDHIACWVREEYERRKKDRCRKEREQAWEEIDRQLRMEPDLAHKYTPGTQTVDPDKQWLAEVELPLQAQTLEVLTADARRMKFPTSGDWWASANAALTDEYLSRAEFGSYIAGDENDTPSVLNQDNANKLVSGLMQHWESQYDFRGINDRIDAEAFKYGAGVGVCRLLTKSVIDDSRGNMRRNVKFPALVPRSIRRTFLDDSEHALMAEGRVVAPGHIFEKTMKLEDLKLAAAKGSSDPDDMAGGWMPKALKGLDADDRGQVKLLEFEGDLVVPRKTTGSLYLPGVVVTVAMSGESPERVIRWRFNDSGNSYIIFPYHHESLDTPYPTSPLMKGWPIQGAAAQILGRLMEVGALQSQPPIGYDPSNPALAASGGPVVFPGAQWPTLDEIKVHDNIGDPGALFSVYVGLLSQYADVTGVNAPRLGAQTVSHTTAFAKEAEISRGTIRTVDYVRSSLKGPMTQWLYKAWEMGRKTYKEDTYYIPSYKGFVTVPKAGLPDSVVFEAFGAGAPDEQQAMMQSRLQALQMAFQIESLAANAAQIQAATGKEPIIDHKRAIEEVLREGGWTDIDAILGSQEPLGGASVQPPMGQGAGGAGVNAAPGAALQALSQTGIR